MIGEDRVITLNYPIPIKMEVVYRDHEGHESVRRIIPITMWYGESEWHGTCWHLRCQDVTGSTPQKLGGVSRDFKLNDILEWRIPE